jgi:ACT domain
VATCVLRVGMPDRPGALGAVASRIGAVRADVVGIEILTRSDGRAMDEIAVEVDNDLLPLLISEVHQVDGVVVEEVRTIPGPVSDRRLDAYRTALALLEARTPDELLGALASRVEEELHSEWVAVVDTESELLLASAGRPSPVDWLSDSFHRSTGDRPSPTGAQSNAEGDAADDAVPSDVLWTTLARFDAALGVGRSGWPFSHYEHQKVETMALLADARWSEVRDRQSRAASG